LVIADCRLGERRPIFNRQSAIGNVMITRMDLQGRVALITGAKRIGAVVAQALAARGVSVALSYARSEAEARTAAAAVDAAGARAAVLRADLSEPDACLSLVDGVVSTFGRLDILINMASVYTNKPLAELTLADWDAVVNVDLRAAFLCARAAIPHMRRQGGGRIINFSDWVAASSRPRYLGFVPYYVAKAGVKALTEALALELAPDNILVNAIAPGPIVAPPGTTVDEHKAVEEATPLGRWGGEAEIAKMVLALLDSDFVTGETVRVDGGRHLR
jgi:NAD(P)-dependent dehydrogenase (short-subunit alcohol dehydrogenase family)